MKATLKVMMVAAFATICFFVEAKDTLPTWSGPQLRDWTFRGNLSHRRVENGVLVGETAISDAQLQADVQTPFMPRQNHEVRFRLRVSGGGVGQIFWRGEKDAEMTQSRRCDFEIPADGAWHDYRCVPYWQGASRIVQVRLDVPHELPLGSRVELASFEIVEVDDPAIAASEGATGVVFDLTTTQMEFVTLQRACEFVPGLSRTGFTTPPDGLRHSYWFDFGKITSGRMELPWKGRAIHFRICQHLKGRDLPVEGLRWVRGVPDLPADPAFTSARPEEAIPRAGRPFPIELIVRNYGTRPVTGIRFAVEGLPKGVKVAYAAELAPTGTIAACEGRDSVGGDMGPGLPNERRFRVILTDPGVADFRTKIRLSADGGIVRMAEVRVKTLPSLGLAKADYPPEPKPISTAPYSIGAFLFPGWDTHRWHGVWSRGAQRKPLLGWYDETNPEIIDWQIKHMVENGISFVYVDWYWNKGRQTHNHWMRQFPKTRYHRYLRWAVMWANHNAAGSHSLADQKKATRFWIENYFGQKEYLTKDGKPVVTIWAPWRMERELKGKGGCRALLEYSRLLAREAGYPGIWFVAVREPDGRTDREYLKTYEDMGFDATCVYKYFGNGRPDLLVRNGIRQFGWVAETSAAHWREVKENSHLPFLPSLSTSYDTRVWRVDYKTVVEGFTVDHFRRICRDARAFSDETGIRELLVGPLDEWGEGSIGYPNAEWGFGVFEAIRDAFGRKPAFGWPQNFAPEDIGLGPYSPKSDELSSFGEK